MAREPYEPIRCQVAAPMQRQDRGPLDHYEHDQLAELIVSCLPDDCVVNKAKLSRLSYKDLALDFIEVTGVDDTFEPMMLCRPPPPPGVDGGRGRGRGCGRGRGRDGGAGRGVAGDVKGPIDFMDVFADLAPPPAKPVAGGEQPLDDGDDCEDEINEEGMEALAHLLGLPPAFVDAPELKELCGCLGKLRVEMLVPDDFAEEVDDVLDGIEGEVEGEEDAEKEEEAAVAEEDDQDLCEIAGRKFQTRDGRVVGQLHKVGVGAKATCKMHPSCVCWVSRNNFEMAEALEHDLIEWLRENARPEPVSAEAHAISAYHLKVAYGMKPRRPPGL